MDGDEGEADVVAEESDDAVEQACEQQAVDGEGGAAGWCDEHGGPQTKEGDGGERDLIEAEAEEPKHADEGGGGGDGAAAVPPGDGVDGDDQQRLGGEVDEPGEKDGGAEELEERGEEIGLGGAVVDVEVAMRDLSGHDPHGGGKDEAFVVETDVAVHAEIEKSRGGAEDDGVEESVAGEWGVRLAGGGGSDRRDAVVHAVILRNLWGRVFGGEGG